MPWLAPFATPFCDPTTDIHAPSWQSSRAAAIRRIAPSPPAARAPAAAARATTCRPKTAGVDRAEILHRMIDRADAGGQEQPFRRVRGDRRIEDHHARHHQGWPKLSFTPRAGSVQPAKRGVFAGRERGRHGDRAQPGRRARRAGGARRPVRMRGTERIEPVRRRHVVAEAQPDHLRRVRLTDPPPSVSSRSAPASRATFAAATTSGRGVCAPIRVHTPANRLPRRVAHWSTRSVSRAHRAAGQHEDRARVQPRQPRPPAAVGEGLAVDHAVHVRKAVGPRHHR